MKSVNFVPWKNVFLPPEGLLLAEMTKSSSTSLSTAATKVSRHFIDFAYLCGRWKHVMVLKHGTKFIGMNILLLQFLYILNLLGGATSLDKLMGGITS